MDLFKFKAHLLFELPQFKMPPIFSIKFNRNEIFDKIFSCWSLDCGVFIHPILILKREREFYICEGYQPFRELF